MPDDYSMHPSAASTDVFLQTQINKLQQTTAILSQVTESAATRAGTNEERLINLLEQVTRMDGTMLRMRADQLVKSDLSGMITKDDLTSIVNVEMDRRVAKGIWVFAVLVVGAAVTWVANHLPWEN